MVTAADIVRCPEGGILVVDGVVLSAWTQAYNERAVALLETAVKAASSAQPDRLGALGVYRIKGLREVPSTETRSALASIGKAYPFKVMSTVLDSSGFANAVIRLFLTGLASVMGGSTPMVVAGSVDEGLAQLTDSGLDVDTVRPALALLMNEVFGPGC